MTQKHIGTRFFIGMILTSGLIILSAITLNPNTPRPRPETHYGYSGDIYHGAYSETALDHLLFMSGVAGWEQRIKNSDIILAGSSHTQFGLDPDLLSQLLEQKTGRHYTIINIGRGHGDGVALTRYLLEKYDISHKIVVIDIHDDHGGELSPYAKTVMRKNRLRIYLDLANFSINEFFDRLRDDVKLPAIIYDKGKFELKSWTSAINQRSLSGKSLGIWTPDKGEIYNTEHPLETITADKVKPIADAEKFVTSLGNEWCDKRHLTCFYITIPYLYGDTANVVDMLNKNHMRYIPLNRDGLTYYDRFYHLDNAGRKKVTQDLANKLAKALQP